MISTPADDEPVRAETAGMCYVVAVRGPDGSPPTLRVRFELRRDLTSSQRQTVNVAGVDEACEVFRSWLIDASSRRE